MSTLQGFQKYFTVCCQSPTNTFDSMFSVSRLFYIPLEKTSMSHVQILAINLKFSNSPSVGPHND